jgi:uncharacterized damage-inducible protein DinB
MSETTRRTLVIPPLPDCEPEIARLLWMLADGRRRLKESLNGLTNSILDWRADEGGNTIATLLYHIVAVEMDWLYAEVLQQPFSAKAEALLPFEMRGEHGALTAVANRPLSEHLQRLDNARDLLLNAFRAMTLTDFRRARSLEQYDVTPEWVLHHLIQHEAEHRGQMMALRSRAESEITD